MKSWECPYCGAGNNTGRCTKCGAFFENDFGNVVEEETFVEMIDTIFEEKAPVETETKTFEKVLIQKQETQTKMAKCTFPVTRRKKKNQTFRIESEQLLGAIIIITFLVFMPQPIALKQVMQVEETGPPVEPTFQLYINIMYSNGQKYVGNVEILDHGCPAERFYMENGEYSSQLCYYTDAELTFAIFNESESDSVIIHKLSFADKSDWEPRIYFGYPVFIKLDAGW
jgi:hypothetical protein